MVGTGTCLFARFRANYDLAAYLRSPATGIRVAIDCGRTHYPGELGIESCRFLPFAMAAGSTAGSSTEVQAPVLVLAIPGEPPSAPCYLLAGFKDELRGRQANQIL